MADFRDELSYFFSTIKLKEVPAPTSGKVLTLNSTTPLLEAVTFLKEHNVSSCPVRDVTQPGDAPWHEKYCGVADIVGIAFFIVAEMEKTKARGLSLDDLKADSNLHSTPISQLSSTARWGPFVPLDVDSSMLDAMLVMGKYGLHRIPVVKKGGDIVNIITQSAVIDAIAKHTDQFHSVCSRSLEALGLASEHETVSIKHDATLRQALQLLRANGLGALPVLGVRSELIGVVSARDLRNLITNPDLFNLLDRPVRQFIAEVSMIEHEAMSPAISCRPSDNLGHVIQQLSTSRIHRIFVCDDEAKPIRVLTLTDILNALVVEPDPHYFEKYFVNM